MTERKRDTRPTLTLKGEAFTPEFRARLNRAAKKAGMTQAEFVAKALDRASRYVLDGKGQTAPAKPEAAPPAPVLAKRIEETDQKVDALADQVRELSELQRRSFWQRLRGTGHG